MIVIVDYQMGNIGSIMNMIRRAGGESVFSSDPDVIASAKKLILPGVGHFDQGIKKLQELELTDILHQKVMQQRTPVLGICLGMQLMSHSSEEGSLPGLGWLEARTVRFKFETGSELRIPHMGWNDISIIREGSLFVNMPEDPSFYFVHSYHLQCYRLAKK